MPEQQQLIDRPGARLLLTLACLVVVVAGLKAAESIILPCMFAAFMAVISAPAMFWLQRKGMPQGAAVTIVVLLVVGFLVGVGTLVGSSVNDFSEALPRYKESLSGIVGSTTKWLEGYGVDVGRSEVLNAVDPGQAMGLASSALSQIATTLSDMLFVILTMIFLLFEAAGIPDKIRVALDDPKADLSKFAKVSTEINRYLVIKTLVSLGTGVSVGLWCWAWGVDFPFLWGLTGFLLNFIPNLGSIIAAVPPVLLALIQFGGVRALIIGAGYVAVNLVMGNVVEPHFMGRKLGLSSLVVFLSLVVWGWLWGPMGMLLSVPLTMIVKIMLENSQDFKGVAVFLGPNVTPARVEDTSASAVAMRARRGAAVWGSDDEEEADDGERRKKKKEKKAQPKPEAPVVDEAPSEEAEAPPKAEPSDAASDDSEDKPEEG